MGKNRCHLPHISAISVIRDALTLVISRITGVTERTVGDTSPRGGIHDALVSRKVRSQRFERIAEKANARF